MVKPHVGIEVKESAFFLGGIQVEDSCSDRLWPAQSCRTEPRAQDQGHFACSLERPVPGACCGDLRRRTLGARADRRTRAGARAPAHGIGDSKKSLEASPVDLRLKTARELGRRYPLRMVCRLLGVPRSSALYKAQPSRDLEPLSRVILTNLVTFPDAGFRWMYM